jgi:tetratricopeptide (TPR) repeat protein
MFKSALIIITTFYLSAYSVAPDRELDRLLSKQKYSQAAEYIEKNYPADQRTGDLWVKAGFICENLNMKEKAMSCYLSACKLDNNDYHALMPLGRLYTDLGFPSLACITFQRIILNREGNPEVSWELARAYLKMNKHEDAKKYLAELPNKPEAQRELGLILLNQKKILEAIPILRKYFYQKQDSTVARRLCEYYIGNRKIGECSECFQYIISKDKTAYSIILALARYSFEISGDQSALEFYALVPENKYEAVDYYNIAIFKKAAGRYEDAIQFFSKAIDLSMKNYEIKKNSNANLALIYLDLKNYVKALECLKYAGDDRVPNFYLHLARCYDALKDYKTSEFFAEKYLKSKPDNVNAHMILITSYEKQNLLTKAKELRNKLFSLDPKNSVTQFEVGDYYYADGQYSQAIRFFEKSYLLDQKSECLERIAECAYKTGQHDKARDACESLLKISNSNEKALDLAFRIYHEEKRFLNEERCLEKLVQLVPNKLDYCIELSACYEILKRNDKMPALDEKIIELSPTNEKSKRRLAEFRFKNGKFEDALNLYNDLIRMEKILPTDYPNIIQISLSLNLKSKAIEYLKQYILLQPNDASLYKKLGDLYYEQKNFEEAFNYYQIALDKKPEITGIYCNYSKILSTKKTDIRKIVAVFEKAIFLEEADFIVYVDLANIYYSWQNYSKALVNYDKALRLNPKDILIFSRYADCQLKMGLNDPALISYEQLIIMDPKTRVNFKILGNLYLKKNKVYEAIQNFKKYLENAVDDSLATFVATYEYKQGSFKEALKYFEKMVVTSQQTLFPQAECRLFTKDYKGAVSDFKKYLEKYRTRYYETNKELAVAYDSLKDSLNALKYYRIYLQKDTSQTIAYRVGTLQEGKNTEEAKQIYLNNSAIYPTDFRNFLRLGALNDKTPAKALTFYQKATSLNDTLLWVWLKIGALCDSIESEEGKITAYKKAISLSPQNFEANKYLGITLFNKGKFDEGLLYLELARSKDATDPEIMYTLGKSYALKGNNTEALLSFKTAKKLQLNNVQIRYTLVYHLFTLKQYEEALKESQELLKLKDTKNYFDLHISILFKMKKYNAIEEAVKQRRKQNPESVDLLMTLAKAQTEAENYDEAIESYKLISFVKEYAPGYYYRAEIYMKLQKITEAKMYYEKALKINAAYPEAEVGLARLYKLSGQRELYFEHLKKAQQLDPKNTEVLIEMNQIRPLQ